MNANVKSHNHTVFAHGVALWLACALVATSAFASDSRSESVKFADLNLSSPAGVETLYGRIHAAAKRVCLQPAGELWAARSCERKAESEAIAKVNLPLLTAFYEQKTGVHPQTIIASR